MSKRKKEFSYSETFDRLMGERFGEKFDTFYNIFSMSYTTVRENGKKLTKEMATYGRGLSDGMAELQP